MTALAEKCDAIGNWLQGIADVLWGMPFIVFVICVGLYYVIGSGFFSFRYFGHTMKYTLGKMQNKESNSKASGRISPFEAACITVGSSVGGTNISGVATAIATGGPGAIFWMWLWALCGMIFKCAEVSLACYYRNKDEHGEYYGGTTVMVEKALIKGKGWKWAAILMYTFGWGFIFQFVGGSQAYTLSETIQTAFGIPQMVITLLYTVFVYYIIWRGKPRIAKFATKSVPAMCVLYVVLCLGVILANITQVPAAIVIIFKSAFTPTAAVGGFAGSTVSHMMRVGLSRSINSNEAGQGSSPLCHSSAHTIHPVRQGLWGSCEVFVDTVIVCSATALAVVCSGMWSSGIKGASLTMASFETLYGSVGPLFICFLMFMFGLTTTCGVYTYYNSLFMHLLRNHPAARDTCIKCFRIIFPLSNVFQVGLVVLSGGGAALNWAIADLCLIIPVFINLIIMLIMSPKFFQLLRDYKARYMGIGTVNPNFQPFYDNPPSEKEVEDLLSEG